MSIVRQHITRETYDSVVSRPSQYGPPHERASLWFWQEVHLPSRLTTGVTGFIKASTEMEAIDRLRELDDKVGAIEWVGRRSDPFIEEDV